jgi:hypothetical protein
MTSDSLSIWVDSTFGSGWEEFPKTMLASLLNSSSSKSASASMFSLKDSIGFFVKVCSA